MKEMDSLLPRDAAILSSAAFDPVDLGMLDSCLLGKLLLRHASLKPRFDHRAHDLGLGLKGIHSFLNCGSSRFFFRYLVKSMSFFQMKDIAQL